MHDEHRAYEAVRYGEYLHIEHDRLNRGEQVTSAEHSDANAAIEWFSFWFFSGGEVTGAELDRFDAEWFRPLLQSIAAKYGKLAEVADQYAVPPEPFFQAQSLIHGLADGTILAAGASRVEKYRDALRILNEGAINGSPAHVAIAGAVRKLRGAVLRSIKDEFSKLSARDALNALQRLNDISDRASEYIDGFTTKWPHGPLSQWSVQQRQNYQTEWKEWILQEQNRCDAAEERAIAMERIAELLPQYHLDPGPIRGWLNAWSMEGEAPEPPESLPVEKAEWRRSNGLDMEAVNALIGELSSKLDLGEKPAAPAPSNPPTRPSAAPPSIQIHNVIHNNAATITYPREQQVQHGKLRKLWSVINAIVSHPIISGVIVFIVVGFLAIAIHNRWGLNLMDPSTSQYHSSGNPATSQSATYP